MKKTLALSGILALAMLAGCSADQATSPAPTEATEALKAAVVPLDPTATAIVLAPEVAEGLAFMREEEKLARDVYQVLGRKWNVRTFSSIMESEQRHTDAIKVLLDRYGLPDPSSGLGAGQFANTELQALYDALVADGLVSLRAAAQVGKLIEVTDIADIDTRLAQVPAGSDIAVVYGNLRLGSESHLAAFTTLLQRVR